MVGSIGSLPPFTGTMGEAISTVTASGSGSFSQGQVNPGLGISSGSPGFSRPRDLIRTDYTSDALGLSGVESVPSTSILSSVLGMSPCSLSIASSTSKNRS